MDRIGIIIVQIIVVVWGIKFPEYNAFAIVAGVVLLCTFFLIGQIETTNELLRETNRANEG